MYFYIKKALAALSFRQSVVFAAILLTAGVLSTPLFADETIKVKILAVNPSSSQALKTTISQYLPPEVNPEDVLDSQGMQVVYDPEKRACLVKKEVELKPQETQTVELKIRNVWQISAEEIEDVKKQLKQSLDALSTTKYGPTGKLLFEKANEVLSQIEENQNRPGSVNQKIELYRMNVKQIEDLRHNALSLDAMRGLEEDQKTGVMEVQFVVSAQNPAAEEKKLVVRSELPRDIKASDIIDAAGFNVVFDEAKQRFVVEREETIGANQSKKYSITLRDVWSIPQQELDFLKVETEKLVPLFQKSPYEQFAVKQSELIMSSLADIQSLQTEAAASAVFEDRVRAHVLNEQRQKFAKRKIQELQDLLTEISIKSAEDEGNKILRYIRRIFNPKEHMTVEMGVQPKKNFVWWVLLGIVAFLGLISAIFYGTWLQKLGQKKFAKPAPKSKPGKA